LAKAIHNHFPEEVEAAAIAIFVYNKKAEKKKAEASSELPVPKGLTTFHRVRFFLLFVNEAAFYVVLFSV